MQLQFVLITVSCLIFTSTLPSNKVFKLESYHDDIDELSLLRRPAQLDRNKPLDFFRKWRLNSDIRLKRFSWKDCGNGSSIVSFKDFKLTPDPIILPGTINIGFNIDISEDIVDGLSGDVLVKKKVGKVWVPMPLCISRTGSCHFDNVCSMLPTPCPNILSHHNIPCRCPFKKNEYVLPLSGVLVDFIKLSGDYYAKIVLKQKEKIALCFKSYFSFA